MGSASSKAARTAASTTARKYPTRPSPATRATPPATSKTSAEPTHQTPGPVVHPDSGASAIKNDNVRADASDPVLDSKLRQIGPVASNPYHSNSATTSDPKPRGGKGLAAQYAPKSAEPPPGLFPSEHGMRNNPALIVLQARSRLAERVDREFDSIGRQGFRGREFMDVGMVKDALRLRQQGADEADIEQKLGLKSGVLKRLGAKGVLEPAYG